MILGPWSLRAACAEIGDTALWFPERRPDTTGLSEEDIVELKQSIAQQSTTAKRICGRCDVAAECLEWAIRNNESGIWGGTTEKQRQALRRERGLRADRIDHGTEAGYRAHLRRGDRPCSWCAEAARVIARRRAALR